MIYRIGDVGLIYTSAGARKFGLSDGPVLTPVPLDAKLAVTGHSVPDNIFDNPFGDVVAAAGLTPDIHIQLTPGSGAAARWEHAYGSTLKADMEAPGASFDMFLGIEAFGGSYGSPPRSSVVEHITFSNGYAFALLWHNLAASTGAQTFYANFWRDAQDEDWNANWRATCEPEAVHWDGIIDYVNANRDEGSPAMRLVPWLQVMAAVWDAIDAGTITSITMGDIFNDYVHCETPVGQWLQLATVLAVMYQRHPNELPNSIPLQGGGALTIDSGLAAQLRVIVWSVCTSLSRTGLPP